MRHFAFLPADERAQLFLRPPQDFTCADSLDVLAMALGASLYSPATRPKLCAELIRSATRGVVSVVLCLEDSVPDAQLGAAEQNLLNQLRTYAGVEHEPLMVFVRVRSAEQIPMIVDGLGDAHPVLTGFVVPKFSDADGAAYLDAIVAASGRIGRTLLAMPVLESPQIGFAESRLSTLLETRALLQQYPDTVLAVRLGATDLSAPFGLRRSRDMTVYDVRLLADVISDVVNVFTRGDAGYTVTGPVWEYFTGAERMFKPQLRETPFREHHERRLRKKLIKRDLDGLIREIALDRANGLTGKTVIHPSHVAAVHALSVATHEEYQDAVDIAGTRGGGGVQASTYQNKMNESKPHSAWAQRILLRARVFGVAAADVSFVDLLGASLPS